MKLLSATLPFVSLTSAFVLPDLRVAQQPVQAKWKQSEDGDSYHAASSGIVIGGHVITSPQKHIDIPIASVVSPATQIPGNCQDDGTKFDMAQWLESGATETSGFDYDEDEYHYYTESIVAQHALKLELPGDSEAIIIKPTWTAYEFINHNEHFSKLAKLINEFPDLVESLNGTESNYTIFAPRNIAFQKLPHPGGGHKPSAETIKKILSYHIVPGIYNPGDILVSHTIPTTLEESFGPQRLRVGLGLAGAHLNFYSKLHPGKIPATNGAIYAVDSILLPPPPALKIINALPGEFSTLQLALIKTGLMSEIIHAPHTGGTFFAPSNTAFKKLGPRINAFLFSSHGEKYLKALLKYHIAANQTLYSDNFYKAKSEGVSEDIPKGVYHIDLETLLKERSLSIDIARWGRMVRMKINGFQSVAVQDGIAHDGVIHVVSNVLIPPKTPGTHDYMGQEMSVEELKYRLDNFIPEL